MSLTEDDVRRLFDDQVQSLPDSIDVPAAVRGVHRHRRNARLLTSSGIVASAVVVAAAVIPITMSPSVAPRRQAGPMTLGPSVDTLPAVAGKEGYWASIVSGGGDRVWAVGERCADPAKPKTCAMALASSTDLGRTWTARPVPSPQPSPALAFDDTVAADGDHVWVVHFGGPVQYSADAGAHWATSTTVVSFFTNPHLAVIGHRLVMVRSSGLPDATLDANGKAHENKQGCDHAYALTVYDGANQISSTLLAANAASRQVTLAPDGSVWQTGARRYRCFSSGGTRTAGPLTVRVAGRDGHFGAPHGLPANVDRVTPVDMTTAYASTTGYGPGRPAALVTHDGGATWTRLAHAGVPSYAHPYPLDATHVLLGWDDFKHTFKGERYYLSTDSGSSASSVLYVTAAQQTSAPLVLDPQHVAIILGNADVYLSSDGGATWHNQGSLPRG